MIYSEMSHTGDSKKFEFYHVVKLLTLFEIETLRQEYNTRKLNSIQRFVTNHQENEHKRIESDSRETQNSLKKKMSKLDLIILFFRDRLYMQSYDDVKTMSQHRTCSLLSVQTMTIAMLLHLIILSMKHMMKFVVRLFGQV